MCLLDSSPNAKCTIGSFGLIGGMACGLMSGSFVEVA